MAEAIVGVVAGSVGIATFAGSLVKGVVKIRSLCKDVKNAPEELEDLLDRLENIGRILQELGSDDMEDTRGPTHATWLQECISRSKTALKRINDTASHLETELKSKKHRTALKIVLKKESLESLVQKLDRSVGDLSLAVNIYMSAQTNSKLGHLTSIVVSQGQVIESTQTIIVQQTVRKDRSGTLQQRQSKRYRSEFNSAPKRYQFRQPQWPCQHAWDVSVQIAIAGWSMTFKSYRVVRGSHAAWAMCGNGNLQGFKQLLYDGDIGLHDQDERGRTYFTETALNGHTDFTKFLLENGVEDFQSVWAGHPEFYITNWSDWRLEACRRHATFLIEEGDCTAMDDDTNHVLQVLSRPCRDLTDAERIEVFSRTHLTLSESEVHELLGAHPIDNRFFEVEGPYQRYLLHELAHLFKCGGYKSREDHWCAKMIDQAVRSGVELHKQAGLYGFTPLMEAACKGRRPGEQLQRWAALIEQTGVNLYEYGSIEEKLLRAVLQQSSREHSSIRKSPFGPEILESFAYGIKVSDWQFWLRHPGDEFAGIFWDMVEHPERAIPGAWLERKRNDGVEWATTYALKGQEDAGAARGLRKEHAVLHPWSNDKPRKAWAEALKVSVAKDGWCALQECTCDSWKRQHLSR